MYVRRTCLGDVIPSLSISSERLPVHLSAESMCGEIESHLGKAMQEYCNDDVFVEYYNHYGRDRQIDRQTERQRELSTLLLKD